MARAPAREAVAIRLWPQAWPMAGRASGLGVGVSFACGLERGDVEVMKCWGDACCVQALVGMDHEIGWHGGRQRDMREREGKMEVDIPISTLNETQGPRLPVS